MDEIDFGPSAIRKARIEIIPLIDVIFFLLATFVLFTLSLQKISTVDVQLPIPGPPGDDDTTVSIQVSGDGTFYWKQGKNLPELISALEIRPRLENYQRSGVAVPRVFIRSDRAAKFGAAVMVLDEVRRAKIVQVSVETFTSPTGS